MKWVPLIGMYSGMRLNEICQLQLTDIRESKDGIPYFDVTDSDDPQNKRKKNDNSKRAVPIHPELVSLGLLQYVEELNRARRVFPGTET